MTAAAATTARQVKTTSEPQMFVQKTTNSAATT